ncbi:MAG TPA: phytanoyl-CoA dioxygenase family protein [Acidimicrobiales bacterium]|nr:phytanoyl-CoA dioxygenase family protein [Acidimicrobiales bacterium]
MEGFVADELPGLLERNGRLVARGMAFYGVPPLAVDVGGEAFSIVCDDDGRTASVIAEPGRADGALVVELDAEQFSDFTQDLRCLNTFWVAGDVPLHGSAKDLAAWDVIWRALLDGWVVHQPGMIEFIAANGTPLDLGRGFRPDDDPTEIAHFLREAGFLHLRGWFDPDDMAAIAADMDRALPTYRPDDGRSWWATLSDGTDTCVRMQRFVDHSPTTAALLAGPVWTRLRRTIGDDAGDPLEPSPARGLEALVKPLGVVQGLSDLPWHRDCSLGRHSYKCCSVTVGVSVTAGGPTSGQLRVVAGSHRANVPATGVRRDLDLPIVPLPTVPGDLTVHLSCTLHEATAPVDTPRKVLYSGFGQPPRPDDGWTGLREARDLRERAHKLRSQVPSPVPAVPARGSA